MKSVESVATDYTDFTDAVYDEYLVERKIQNGEPESRAESRADEPGLA